MARVDISQTTDVVNLFNKVQVTANQTIQGTDISEYHSAMFVVDVGAHTADDLVVTFQHRDGSDAWADIPDNDLSAANDIAITEDHENGQVKVTYSGNKEQIGAIITDGGTGDAVVGIYVVKAHKSQYDV